MDFHPKDLPVSKTYSLTNEGEVAEAVDDMVRIGFRGRKDGFRILMPKEPKTAKKIGYMVTTGVTHGLRKKNEVRDVRYWTYHHDKDHYAIVLISGSVLESSDF